MIEPRQLLYYLLMNCLTSFALCLALIIYNIILCFKLIFLVLENIIHVLRYLNYYDINSQIVGSNVINGELN